MKLNHILLFFFCSIASFFPAIGMLQSPVTEADIVFSKQTTNSQFDTILKKFEPCLANPGDPSKSHDLHSYIRSLYDQQAQHTPSAKAKKQSTPPKQKKKKETPKQRKQRKKKEKEEKENRLLTAAIAQNKKERMASTPIPSPPPPARRSPTERKTYLKQLMQEKKEREKQKKEKKEKEAAEEFTESLMKIARLAQMRKLLSEKARTYVYGRPKGARNVHGGNITHPYLNPDNSQFELPDSYIRRWIGQHEEIQCPGIDTTPESNERFFSVYHQDAEEFMTKERPCCPIKFTQQIIPPDCFCSECFPDDPD